MARCPFCDHILSDEWVKRVGASLMGKARSGKARSHKVASGAALLRWDQEQRKGKKKKE